MNADALFAFENAPVGLVVTRHRLIDQCNPFFANMFGYRPNELVGKSLALLYPTPKEFADLGILVLRQMNLNQRYRDDRIMQRRDGSQFWCQVFGQSTTPQDPYAHCVWTFIDLSDQRPVVDLTRREREIAMLLIEGLTNKHIGQKLGILHRTVEAHRSRMMRKLSAKNSAELLSNSSAYQLGVITQC